METVIVALIVLGAVFFSLFGFYKTAAGKQSSGCGCSCSSSGCCNRIDPKECSDQASDT